MDRSSYPKLTRRQYHLLGITFLLITVAFLVLGSALDLDFAQLLESFRRYHLVVLVPALVCVLLQVFCRTVRLWVIFPAGTEVSWKRAAQAYSYGQFLNTLVPARAGDLVKGVYLTQRGDETRRAIRLTESLGLLMADRIADGAAFVALALVAMFLNSRHFVNWMVQQNAWPYVLGATVLVAGSLAVFFAAKWRFPRLLSAIENFMRGMAVLRDGRRMAFSLAMATGAWFAEMGAMHLLCLAQGISLSFDQMVWVLVVLNVGIAIPISFANIGTFEAMMTLALLQLGVSLPQALSISTVHHVLQVLGVALWAIGMWAARKIRAVVVSDSGEIPHGA